MQHIWPRWFCGIWNFCARALQERENNIRKCDPAGIDELVAEFANLHARSSGALLLARHEGQCNNACAVGACAEQRAKNHST